MKATLIKAGLPTKQKSLPSQRTQTATVRLWVNEYQQGATKQNARTAFAGLFKRQKAA